MGKFHFETEECQKNLLPMDIVNDKIRLDFDAPVLNLFGGAFSGNRKILSIVSSIITYTDFCQK